MLRRIRKHALITLASAALGLVSGFILATVSWPFWGWFEEKTGIESLGHGGPDDWVYEFLWAVSAITLFVVLEWMFRDSSRQSRNRNPLRG